MLAPLSSGSGRGPLDPIHESSSIRASRNASRSRIKRTPPTEKVSVSCQSTVSRPQPLLARPLGFKKDELEPSKRGAKRCRTEDHSNSTPCKDRKLSCQDDGSPLSTPESARYDSGIEMTPESTTEDIDVRPQSPCERISRENADKYELDSSVCGQSPSRKVRKAATAHSKTRRRSPRTIQHEANSDSGWLQHDCAASPLSQGEQIAAKDRDGDADMRTADPGTRESQSPTRSSDHRWPPNAATTNSQLTWQPHGSTEDVSTLLSILGETVVQQQRTKTVLQRWLRSHDDHRMFWLNYGGSSSPSDYLRWTKKVSPKCDLEDL